jgi:hypothetical protein
VFGLVNDNTGSRYADNQQPLPAARTGGHTPRVEGHLADA